MTQSLNDLLSDMRRQVQYSDKATMPIPLYERMKAVIIRRRETQQPDKAAALKQVRAVLDEYFGEEGGRLYSIFTGYVLSVYEQAMNMGAATSSEVRPSQDGDAVAPPASTSQAKTLIDCVAEVMANGWVHGTHPKEKARIVLNAIRQHEAEVQEPIISGQVQEENKLNLSDTLIEMLEAQIWHLESFEPHSRLNADALGQIAGLRKAIEIIRRQETGVTFNKPAHGGACCENGYFGTPHDCMKGKPSEITENLPMIFISAVVENRRIIMEKWNRGTSLEEDTIAGLEAVINSVKIPKRESIEQKELAEILVKERLTDGHGASDHAFELLRLFNITKIEGQ